MISGMDISVGGLYFIAINLLTFLLYGLDKYKAVRQEWRIPERILLLMAFLGGAFGALSAMRIFRHKTKKGRFKLMIPLFCLLWGYVIVHKVLEIA
jgi:Predicted membrane protein